eukprot:TRINITY_DN14917_c0_g1_i1.p1 TRINITY_DN14917_c0_g1~~TRINITY_DN14917_c0_g1_i1.p1  ORF type:complete len:933 (+),score=190.73 TRINITY_DN14917_c0_g1_i1:33-2831(+)
MNQDPALEPSPSRPTVKRSAPSAVTTVANINFSFKDDQNIKFNLRIDVKNSLYHYYHRLQSLMQKNRAASFFEEFAIQLEETSTWIKFKDPVDKQNIKNNSNLILVPLSQLTKTPKEEIESCDLKNTLYVQEGQDIDDSQRGLAKALSRSNRRYCVLKGNFVYLLRNSASKSIQNVVSLDYSEVTVVAGKVATQLRLRVSPVLASASVGNPPKEYAISISSSKKEKASSWAHQLTDRALAVVHQSASEDMGKSLGVSGGPSAFGTSKPKRSSANSVTKTLNRLTHNLFRKKHEEPSEPVVPGSHMATTTTTSSQQNNLAASTQTRGAQQTGQGQGQGLTEKGSPSSSLPQLPSPLHEHVQSSVVNKDVFFDSLNKVSSAKREDDDESKKKRKLQELLSEMISSESVYLRNLLTVRKALLVPLAPSLYSSFSSSPPPAPLGIISQDEAALIFSNLQEIAAVSQKMLRLFHGLEDLPPNEFNIGALFLLMVSDLEVYVKYCVDHDSSMNARDKLIQTNKSFREFVTKALEENNEFGTNTSLDNILIQPVQRICRYPLFLEEMRKCTDDAGKRTEIEQAHAAVGELIERSNKLKLVNERKNKLRSLQTQLDVPLPILKDEDAVDFQTRTLVYDGPCLKVKALTSDNGSSRGHIFLFNDAIIVAMGVWNGSIDFVDKEKDKQSTLSPLFACRLWECITSIGIPQKGSKGGCLEIKVTEGGFLPCKGCIVEFPAEDERDGWRKKIDTTLAQTMAPQKTVGPSNPFSSGQDQTHSTTQSSTQSQSQPQAQSQVQAHNPTLSPKGQKTNPTNFVKQPTILTSSENADPSASASSVPIFPNAASSLAREGDQKEVVLPQPANKQLVAIEGRTEHRQSIILPGGTRLSANKASFIRRNLPGSPPGSPHNNSSPPITPTPGLILPGTTTGGVLLPGQTRAGN